jgi:hypothetical protein
MKNREGAEIELKLEMPSEFPDDATIDELLRLAGVSTRDSAARRWLKSAVRGTLDPQPSAAGAKPAPRPSPTRHNAPLEKIDRAAGQLIAAMEELRCHPHSHASFWRSKAFGPVYASGFERAGVMPALTKIRDAARKARVRKTGRPGNFRKQHIVDLALAFCARFSPKKPSSDVNNFFAPFAERFFEYATGLSAENKGQGIGRQIRVALGQLPIEMERAATFKKNTRR